MAFTRLTSTKVAVGTTPSIDTSGADLIVLVQCAISEGTPSDSKSNTWTQGAVQDSGFFGETVSIWYTVPPPEKTGSGHTFTSNGSFSALAVVAYSGAHATPADNVNAGSNSNGSVPLTLQPGSLTPSEDNCLVIQGMGGGTTNLSINGSYAIVQDQDWAGGSNFTAAIAELIQTTATATNPTWTDSTGDGANSYMDAIGMAFKSAGAPPPSTVRNIESDLIITS